MLSFDDRAKAQLNQMIQGQDSSTTGLRIQLKEDDTLTIGLVALDKLEGGEEPLRDKITHFFVEYEGYLLIVDSAGQQKLTDAAVKYEEGGVLEGQFKLELKETLPDAVYAGLDTADPLVQKVSQLLESEINPGLAMHGGRAELLNVLDHKVYLRFGGGCQGCSMIDATVKQGIETRIKQVLPEITGVVDETDHSQGANPYFS